MQQLTMNDERNGILKVGIYVRVSTLEQATEGYSIQEQTDKLKKFCDVKEWTVSDVYTDPGFSGSSLKRPGMQKLINDVEQQRIDAVLVYKLDRLSRSQKDTLYLIEDVFLKYNVHFVSLNENFDTSTPFGRASIGMMSVFAQLEREQITERMQMGKVGRAKAGYFHGGGTIPHGYDYNDGELIPNEKEAKIVNYIFDQYLDGWGVQSIVKHLNAKHISGKRSAKWSHKVVNEVLCNNLYIGKITWKNEIYDGTHTPIIDEDKFYKVQELMAKRKSTAAKNNQRPFKAKYMLTGLAYCGVCGARMFTLQSYSSKQHKYIRKYGCYSQSTIQHMIKDANCDNDKYDGPELETYVLQRIRKLSMNPKTIKRITNQTTSIVSTEGTKTQIKETEEQIERLLDLYQNGAITFAKIESRLDDLNAKKSNLEEQLKRLESEKLNNGSTTDVLELLSNASDVVDSKDYDAQKRLVHVLIQKITLKRDKVTIKWTF